MQDDTVFRIIIVTGAAVIFPIALYYRVKSMASGEKLDRRAEGLFILLTLRPIALARMAAIVAYLINPAWMTWSSVELPLWLRWIGVGIGVTAGILLVVVMRSLGTNLTDTVVTRKHHTLVTSGPYRWVRHPFYAAAALAVTADSLVTENWFLALTGAATIALLVIRTKTEEQRLVARFGDAYTRYMQRTGRFLPRLTAPSS